MCGSKYELVALLTGGKGQHYFLFLPFQES